MHSMRLIAEGEDDNAKKRRPRSITNKASRTARVIQAVIFVTLFFTIISVGLLIAGAVISSSIYNHVRGSMTTSNIQSMIQEVIPKEYLEQIIVEILQGFLANGFEKSFAQQCVSTSTVREKCQMVEYCASSWNVTTCLNYLTNTRNWCKSYL